MKKLIIISSISLFSCRDSKKQMIDDLLSRREMWQKRATDYRRFGIQLELIRYNHPENLQAPSPSEKELLYKRISDTAALQVRKINDSLFQLNKEGNENKK
jgi:hypothetical protein